MVAIRQNLVSPDKWNIKCPYSMTPEYITIHNTANDASANNEIAYMIRNDNYVSFHFAVDDIEAVQGLLLNRNGWHAGDGDGTGNRKTIGIEICYSKSGGDRFIKAEQNAVELIVDILNRYNWGVDKIGTHQMRSGKYCPHRTLDMGWDRFINMVKAKLSLPVPNAIKFDKAKRYICNLSKVQMWDLTTNPNYKSVKEYAKGIVIDAYGYIPFNGTKYLVTEYSFNKGIKNGFNIVDMKEDTSEADKAAADAKIAADKVIADKLKAELAEKARLEALVEAERVAAEKSRQDAIDAELARIKAENAAKEEMAKKQAELDRQAADLKAEQEKAQIEKDKAFDDLMKDLQKDNNLNPPSLKNANPSVVASIIDWFIALFKKIWYH